MSRERRAITGRSMKKAVDAEEGGETLLTCPSNGKKSIARRKSMGIHNMHFRNMHFRRRANEKELCSDRGATV